MSQPLAPDGIARSGTTRVDHVLNSSLVSGPEALLVPNLAGSGIPARFVLLQEHRCSEGAATVADYVRRHGFDVIEVPVRGRWDGRAVDALAALWRTESPGIVHAHGPKATTFAAAAVGRLTAAARARLPLVTTHHGVLMNDRTWPLRMFEWIYERYAMPRCDLVLTVCGTDRALLLRRGVRTPVLVHCNGVDRQQWGPEARAAARRRARAEWSKSAYVDIADDTDVVGVIGRLSGEKRQALAIDAVASIRDPARRPMLVIAGSGPDESALRARAHERSVRDNVAFVGWRHGWATELPGLDLVLSVSSAEGLPIGLIEAGWAGLAVMATQVGGVRDLVPSPEYGYPMSAEITPSELGSQLVTALADDGDRALRGAAYSRHISAHFSRTAWLACLRTAYHTVLDAKH